MSPASAGPTASARSLPDLMGIAVRFERTRRTKLHPRTHLAPTARGTAELRMSLLGGRMRRGQHLRLLQLQCQTNWSRCPDGSTRLGREEEARDEAGPRRYKREFISRTRGLSQATRRAVFSVWGERLETIYRSLIPDDRVQMMREAVTLLADSAAGPCVGSPVGGRLRVGAGADQFCGTRELL
jgi:hypothetical protein